MRTTLDIEAPILKEVKAIRKREGGSLGGIVSRLLADALARRETQEKREPFRWISREMGARVDLSDKDALYAILDAHSADADFRKFEFLEVRNPFG